MKWASVATTTSQRPEARAVLSETAHDSGSKLQLDAIRMLGISGNPDAIASLGEVYASGDAKVNGCFACRGRAAILGAHNSKKNA
jgi:hypothetical protein